jgi:hypothetical protein
MKLDTNNKYLYFTFITRLYIYYIFNFVTMMLLNICNNTINHSLKCHSLRPSMFIVIIIDLLISQNIGLYTGSVKIN